LGKERRKLKSEVTASGYVKEKREMNGFYKFKLLKAKRKEWKTLKFDGSLLLGRKLS